MEGRLEAGDCISLALPASPPNQRPADNLPGGHPAVGAAEPSATTPRRP